MLYVCIEINAFRLEHAHNIVKAFMKKLFFLFYSLVQLFPSSLFPPFFKTFEKMKKHNRKNKNSQKKQIKINHSTHNSFRCPGIIWRIRNTSHTQPRKNMYINLYLFWSNFIPILCYVCNDFKYNSSAIQIDESIWWSIIYRANEEKKLFY